MKIRVLSDIHFEFEIDYKIDYCKNNSQDQVLVFAGDINCGKNVVNFMNEFQDSNFKKVLFVAGNHEFYENKFHDTIRLFTENFPVTTDSKVSFLDNQNIEICGVNFIGCTLWTDFNNENPIDINRCVIGMNDYNMISEFTIDDAIQEHKISRKFLEKQLINNINKKVVIITHMAPCGLSIKEEYKGDPFNSAYFSDLSEMILDYGPDIWIHGHTHMSCDYILGKTRIISNPRGYHNDLNINFNDKLTITI